MPIYPCSKKQRYSNREKILKILLIGANGQLGSDIKKVFRKESDIDLVPLTDRDIDDIVQVYHKVAFHIL